ncbi:MAG: hypothetical protein HYZ54_10515 [Ignavibacteriae bacterium]|nr:hypothetical protein [Ignavibacteriota bacterium]
MSYCGSYSFTEKFRATLYPLLLLVKPESQEINGYDKNVTHFQEEINPELRKSLWTFALGTILLVSFPIFLYAKRKAIKSYYYSMEQNSSLTQTDVLACLVSSALIIGLHTYYKALLVFLERRKYFLLYSEIKDCTHNMLKDVFLKDCIFKRDTSDQELGLDTLDGKLKLLAEIWFRQTEIRISKAASSIEVATHKLKLVQLVHLFREPTFSSRSFTSFENQKVWIGKRDDEGNPTGGRFYTADELATSKQLILEIADLYKC